MSNTKEKLRAIQCPINWNLENVPWTTDSGPKLLLNKLDGEFKDLDGSSIWQKFSQRLVLAYLEYSGKDGDLRKMKNYLDMIEDILNDENKHDDFIKKHLPAIEYVKNGMLVHYYYKVGSTVLAETYLSKPSFEDLPSKTKAGILALKACCIMVYGPGDASKAALETINKSLKLDSEESEWDFLKGKCLARSRRYRKHRNPPSEEERNCLRKAVQSTVMPSHLVFCAQSLLEYASYSSECQGQSRRKFALRESYISECVGLMRRAANLGENHPVILSRVARGLMHQHATDVDELIERCVHKSLDLLPSSGFVNEVAGDYFRYRERNMEKAMRYYSIAAHHHDVSTAYMKLFGLMLLTKPDSELDNEVCRFWERCSQLPLEKLRALPTMTAYYFFVKNDINKAVQYWSEWIASTHLNNGTEQTHISTLFVWTDDLTLDIVGEVKLRLTDPQNNMSTDDEQNLRQFLATVVKARPDINVDEVTTSREGRIKAYLLNFRSCHNNAVLERKFKLAPTSRNASWRGANCSRENMS